MSSSRYTVLSGAVLSLLTACSSSAVDPGARRPVEPERVHEAELLAPDGARTVPLTITRDSGFVGMGVEVHVYVNGKELASLKTKESLTIYLKPDTYILGAAYSDAVGKRPVERSFPILEGRPLQARVTVDQDGNLDIRPETGLL